MSWLSAMMMSGTIDVSRQSLMAVVQIGIPLRGGNPLASGMSAAAHTQTNRSSSSWAVGAGARELIVECLSVVDVRMDSKS